MDEHRFDTWVRTLGAAALSRRRAVGLLPAAIGMLAGLLGPDEVAAACPTGQKRCRKRCIPTRDCCTRADCGPRASGKVCRGGTCCYGTAQALKAALNPGGPATIRLCPHTTYRGRFDITRNVTVVGTGAESTVLRGDWSDPVVTVADTVNAATLRRLRITDGHRFAGGGLFNAGVLTLSACTVTDSWAINGGGILNLGRLTLTRCTVTRNDANYDGGGIANRGTLTLFESTITKNGAYDGSGGGISNDEGTLTLTKCAVTRNGAGGGDGIYRGGGIDNWRGKLTLRDCSVTHNGVTGDGGGLANVGGTVTLAGSTTVADNEAGQGGGIYNLGTAARVTLRDESIVTKNRTSPTEPASGGGIYNADPDGLGPLAPGIVEFFGASRVTGNRPNDCTGVSCPG
jgi:hypothetical protein